MIKFIALLLIAFLFAAKGAMAISDPLANTNNKFGINILSPEANVEDAARLVNTNGDWGYVVIVIKKSERDLARWQSVFNTFSKKHLIPIVRIATDSDSDNEGNWQKPAGVDAHDWANFLLNLTWPTKNRYIQIYNEVNRSAEWGGTVEPHEYAIELNKSIDALKEKSEDFFILNAPLDLALNSSNSSLNAQIYYQAMEESVPGIFNKLDGWASHSYPNPAFSASPHKLGRLGISGYKWELAQIKPYININKELPVFITETGWRRGNTTKPGLNENQIADYFKTAYEEVWNDKQVVAVAPFVLNYQEPLFSQFSFITDSIENKYSNNFTRIRNLTKVKGKPERENLARITVMKIQPKPIINRTYNASITIKNTGNYILNSEKDLKVEFESENIETNNFTLSSDEIYPGQEVTANWTIKANEKGFLPYTFKITSEGNILTKRELILHSYTYVAYFMENVKKIIKYDN